MRTDALPFQSSIPAAAVAVNDTIQDMVTRQFTVCHGLWALVLLLLLSPDSPELSFSDTLPSLALDHPSHKTNLDFLVSLSKPHASFAAVRALRVSMQCVAMRGSR